VLEAMAAAAPVIGSDIGGIGEAVGAQPHGLLGARRPIQRRLPRAARWPSSVILRYAAGWDLAGRTAGDGAISVRSAVAQVPAHWRTRCSRSVIVPAE